MKLQLKLKWIGLWLTVVLILSLFEDPKQYSEFVNGLLGTLIGIGLSLYCLNGYEVEKDFLSNK